MGATPTLIYCAAGNPRLAAIAIAAGFRYGARLPGSVAHPIYFADQEWRNPDRKAYMDAIRYHKPEVATVLDWEREDQEDEVLSWADEAARVVRQVVIIPKWSGCVARCPDRVGTAQVILGYSVPTSYGATAVPVWEFAGRSVHLLGGTPHRQMEYAGYMRVVSTDGSIAAQQARAGRAWMRKKSSKGHWTQLRDLGDTEAKDALYRAFTLSCREIKAAWAELEG